MPAVTFKWQLFENISQKPAKILIFVISVSFILPQRECVLFKIQLFMERSSIGLDHSCGCSQFQLVQKYFYVPCINEASLTHKPCKGACQSLQQPGDKHHAAECCINELCSHSAANKLERLEPCDPTPVNKPCWPLFCSLSCTPNIPNSKMNVGFSFLFNLLSLSSRTTELMRCREGSVLRFGEFCNTQKQREIQKKGRYSLEALIKHGDGFHHIRAQRHWCKKRRVFFRSSWLQSFKT